MEDLRSPKRVCTEYPLTIGLPGYDIVLIEEIDPRTVPLPHSPSSAVNELREEPDLGDSLIQPESLTEVQSSPEQL